MGYYCGMDLGARHCQVCVIDEELSILIQEKVRNELPRIIHLIEPFKEDLRIVVESTFNWYWLIDGLQEAGYDVCLAHTLGLALITGARVGPHVEPDWLFGADEHFCHRREAASQTDDPEARARQACKRIRPLSGAGGRSFLLTSRLY